MAEKLDRRAFVTILKDMLQLDQERRIDPDTALKHTFVTMNHLVDYAHLNNVRMSFQMMEVCNRKSRGLANAVNHHHHNAFGSSNASGNGFVGGAAGNGGIPGSASSHQVNASGGGHHGQSLHGANSNDATAAAIAAGGRRCQPEHHEQLHAAFQLGRSCGCCCSCHDVQWRLNAVLYSAGDARALCSHSALSFAKHGLGALFGSCSGRR